jgi:hypothetical protein
LIHVIMLVFGIAVGSRRQRADCACMTT